MSRQRLNVCSFFVHRPADNVHGHDYPGMLRLLQKSCDRLDLRHVVLTDLPSLEYIPRGMEVFCPGNLPKPLMQACTRVQSEWLYQGEWRDADTLFVGADSIVLRHPDEVFTNSEGLTLTLRPGHPRYPINNGAMMIRASARQWADYVYAEIAERCGVKWGDDQRTLQTVLGPMPTSHGVFNRRGLDVAFVPMDRHNAKPKSANDRQDGACLLHFRGWRNKPLMFAWAAKNFPRLGMTV